MESIKMYLMIRGQPREILRSRMRELGGGGVEMFATLIKMRSVLIYLNLQTIKLQTDIKYVQISEPKS